jgi:hypothetical protein
MPGNVNIIYPDAPSRSFSVPAEVAAAAIRDEGARLETPDDAAARVAEGVKDERYGGVGGTVAAGLLAGARGASGGLSDLVVGGLGLGEDARELQERHGVVSFLGEAGGALASGHLPYSPVGLAAKAGARVGRVAEGAGALERIARAGAGATTEGALLGIGSGVSEVGLSGDFTPENVIGSLSSGALYGGLVGGAAGSLGKSAEIGLQKAKAGIGRLGRGVDDAAGEFRGKTPAELDALHADEVTRLVDEQAASKASAIDDVAAYTKSIREGNPFLIADAEGAAQLAGSSQRLRKALDTPTSTAKNLHRLEEPLERQEIALTRAIDRRDDLLAAFEKTNAKITDDLAAQLAKPGAVEVELSGNALKRYSSYSGTKVPKKTATLAIPREAAEEFSLAIANGAVRSSGEKAAGALDGLLEQNRALQAKIASARVPKSELVSDRLTSIGQARKAAQEAASRPQSLVENIAQGAIFGAVSDQLSAVPVLGPIAGAAVARAAGNMVFGRLGKATSDAAARATRGIDAFLSVGKKVSPAVPVLASKVLARVRYAQAANDNEEAEGARKKDLAALYKARSDELRSQTEYGPDGKAVMRPEARLAMSSQLAGVKARDPLLADQLETIAARRLEYLANKLPRRPDIGGMSLGPDRWQPSDLEMRSFARTAAAVEDPIAIVERLANGTITPEDAEAMRTVYPETMEQIKRRIVEKLPELRETLPYNKRVALSIFSGVPVDPAMRPDILGVLQGQFEEEEGSEGGMTAPKAAPQFGSISKSVPEPTPAQDRAG